MSDAKRSLLRPRNVIGVVLVGAALWAAIAVTQRLTLTPGRAGKFNGELTKLVEDAQASSAGAPNGWPILLEVVDGSAAVAQEWASKDKPADWPERLSWPPSVSEVWEPDAVAGTHAVFREVLKAYRDRGVLERLDALAAAERFVRPTPAGRLMDVTTPELGQVRAAARMCKGRMYFAAMDRDGPEFVRAAGHALALSRACERQPMVMDHLVGGAVNIMTMMTIRDALMLGMLEPATCRELLALLKARGAAYDPSLSLKAEHVSARDAVEWTHSDDGRGDGWLVPEAFHRMVTKGAGGGVSLKDRARLLAQPTKKETLDAFDRFFTMADEEARTPLRARLDRAGPTADQFAESLGPRYGMVRMLAPSASRLVLLSDNEDLELAGTKVMLALEIHRAAHGAYPETFVTLDPGIRSLGLRQDWVDEFRYRLLDPEGRTYRLYWIGIDGRDQGAKTLDDGTNQSAMAKAAWGYDFVFTLPPKAPGGR